MKSRRNGDTHGSSGPLNETNVNRLLRELHEKKRWLDTMIGALEAAANSPHHQFIERAGLIFENLNGSRPKADLGPKQQEILTGLASQIGRQRAKRMMRVEARAA